MGTTHCLITHPPLFPRLLPTAHGFNTLPDEKFTSVTFSFLQITPQLHHRGYPWCMPQVPSGLWQVDGAKPTWLASSPGPPHSWIPVINPAPPSVTSPASTAAVPLRG